MADYDGFLDAHQPGEPATYLAHPDRLAAHLKQTLPIDETQAAAAVRALLEDGVVREVGGTAVGRDEATEFVVGALGNLITDCWRQANTGTLDPAYADTARDLYERFKDGRLTITDAAQVRADERRKVAEEIAAAIEALPGPNGEGIQRMPADKQEGYLLAIEEAADVARIAREAARADTEEADRG